MSNHPEQTFVYESNSGFQSTIIYQMFCNKFKRALTITKEMSMITGESYKIKLNKHTQTPLPPTTKTKYSKIMLDNLIFFSFLLTKVGSFFVQHLWKRSPLPCCTESRKSI